MLALGEEATVQAVVGSIVWAFRMLKKPRIREMSARGYALNSVRFQLSFFPYNIHTSARSYTFHEKFRMAANQNSLK